MVVNELRHNEITGANAGGTTVAGSDALGRPHRSVLTLARPRMKMLSRGMMLALVLLALSQISAAAVSVEYCQVNWTVPRWTPDDTGGHYGVIQFKLGNGPLDAKTVFFFGGHRHLIIRTPLYFIVAMAVVGGSILASAYRALTSGIATLGLHWTAR